MYLWWDPTFILLIPVLILTVFAQARVSRTFKEFSRMRSSFGIDGAAFARKLLDKEGLYNVEIQKIRGNLTDHYDPRAKVIRLSESTYDKLSVAGIGVVAHEIGHAMQDNQGYAPLRIRNKIFPVVNFSSSFSWIIFIVGLLFYSPVMVNIGIFLFTAVVAFSLITLPVEFNASNRAKKALAEMGMPQNELTGVKKVLGAAAMTYVASTAMALVQLLRMILISGRR